MKVFISWSGARSKKLAEAIRDWLPGVIQLVTPYFTPSDVEKGARWNSEIAKELSGSQIGILCITQDNLHSDWLMFEAGALSKSLEKSHVCPILFGITNTDLAGPLKQFQTTEFEKSEFQKLVSVINGRLGENKLAQKTLDAVFEKWWPDLEKKISEILSHVAGPKEPIRKDRELLEEILLLTRSASQRGSRNGVASGAVHELLEKYIVLHDEQERGEGGYQQTLDGMKLMRRPLKHIANKYSGVSEELDSTIAKFAALTYQYSGDDTEDEIPF